MTPTTPYPKINGLYKRTERGEIIPYEYARPEFAYLQHCDWRWTEKVDGTNIRLTPDHIAGRTDRAEIPAPLLAVLSDYQTRIPWESVTTDPITLYGEGYGAKIQGGGKYIPDGVDFVLFDVKIGDWWLCHDDVEEVAEELGVACVPTVLHASSLLVAEGLVESGNLLSAWGDFPAEGLIGRPTVDLCDRRGERVAVKIKAKDYA